MHRRNQTQAAWLDRTGLQHNRTGTGNTAFRAAKTSLDISWIREEDEDANRPLTELMAELKERSERIANSVSQLQELLTNINEATE